MDSLGPSEGGRPISPLLQQRARYEIQVEEGDEKPAFASVAEEESQHLLAQNASEEPAVAVDEIQKKESTDENKSASTGRPPWVIHMERAMRRRQRRLRNLRKWQQKRNETH